LHCNNDRLLYLAGISQAQRSLTLFNKLTINAAATFGDTEIFKMHPLEPHSLQELQIYAENRNAFSAYHFFDKTHTQGGSDYLKLMLAKPKTNINEVRQFQSLIQAILADKHICKIDVNRSYVLAVEGYCTLSVAHSMSQDLIQHWLDTFVYFLKSPEEFYRIQSGLTATLRFLKAFQEMLDVMKNASQPMEIEQDIQFIKAFLSSSTVTNSLKQQQNRLSKRAVFHLDYFFRVKKVKVLRELLDIFYRFDAYHSIAKTAEMHSLVFADFDENCNEVCAENLLHPLIPNGIKNSFKMDLNRGVCIITGANTSGKTTFLKTCGLVLYLAHLGWPVPVTRLRLPFFQRLFTSLHLSDDLGSGYSHFYNEMMRIKAFSEALQQGDRCFILVDEIFRGTNQDDAMFCSKTVLDGFSKYPGSAFMISTHLLDLAESYTGSEYVIFRCFKTTINGNQFKNSFEIQEGIAYEKVGSLIMRNIGITDMLQNAKRPSEH
jgi:DNA mismatch repair ATPase MutS